VVLFSEPMDRASVESAFALLSLEVEVPGNLSWMDDGSRLVFTPDGPMEEGTTYTITVKPSARDVAGNRMEGAFGATFRTGGSAADDGDDGGGGGAGLFWPVLVLVVVLAVGAAWFTLRRRPGPRRPA
jgi:hypothetical protein